MKFKNFISKKMNYQEPKFNKTLTLIKELNILTKFPAQNLKFLKNSFLTSKNDNSNLIAGQLVSVNTFIQSLTDSW